MIPIETALAFSVYENKGVYALLIGSGVSRAAQIPTGWEITLDLTRRVAALEGVPQQPDWAAWHRERFGNEPNYSTLLDQLAGTPHERRAILHSYIEPTAEDVAEGKKTPTKAHRAIARLVQAGFIRVIITTNFDRLIESALTEIGIQPTVIKSDDDLAGAVPLIHARCLLLKLHGDYLDTRIRNTAAELEGYSEATNLYLDRIIDEHGLIICGWSGDWDPALVAAISRAPNRRYSMYWAAKGVLSQAATDLLTHRLGKNLPIEDADRFFDRLEEMVASHADLQRPHPRSVELVVASAKKYVGQPHSRIHLDDLISEEARGIVVAREGAEFAPVGAYAPEMFVRSVARYEVLSEPLVRLMGVIGRWGSEGDLRSAFDTLVQLTRAEPRGGFVLLNSLRTYPAVLSFYACGIGLLRARRFRDLHRLFLLETPPVAGDGKPLVQRLLLGAWEGMEHNEWWQQLPTLEGHRTALSDHLHELFQKWSEDFVSAGAELTALFEEFELLGALAYTTTRYEHAELQVRLRGPNGQNFAFAPTGRAAWDSEIRRPIIDSWTRDGVTQTLLQAGFAGGEQGFLNDAIQSLNRLIGMFAIWG